MKYPQLVSTRAVNAISDWLVSRLEQLGVEAPLIYSRLLLSLLQSSVQINDPIEFSNLETFLANRKGTSKRYPPCDTDTLKKIAAVQCLMDIVSSEQEITKIENLVDELCEKVNDIEKQTTNLEEDDDLQLAASTLNSVLTTRSAENKAQSTSSSTAVEADSSTKKLSQISGLSLSRKTKEQQVAVDAEDPRKRYYRAFPALSKEMDDSITLLRRNTKSLTWPVDRKVNSAAAAATTNEIAPTTAGSVNTSALASSSEQANISTSAVGPSSLLNNSPRGDNKTVLSNTAGVKRKTKRRRNQAMSKGKTTAGNNTRKNSYCGGSSSPTWDTDFEGSWEMGRDLIKEFIVKQNNRNRSTSESAAYNMASGGGSNTGNNMGANEVKEKRMKSVVNEHTTKKQEPIAAEVNQQYVKNHQHDEMAAAEQCVVEISFCDDLVDNSKSDDTLASVSEITEGSLSTARRLYERDISNDSINEQSVHDNPSHHPSSSASSSEQLDFAQFKAKFNSSVEALWKNSNSSGGSMSGSNQSKLQLGVVGTDSGVSAAPYRSEDLKNFWTNYYSHHYDVDRFQHSNNDSCDYSTMDASAMGYTSKADGHSDYFSLPTISAGVGGSEDFDKSVGGKRAAGKSSPIGVFLQNTIWSENLNTNYSDTDESFYKKVLNSTASTQKSQDQFKMDSDKSYYYPYQTSKWSEGINGVPHSGNNITVQQHPCQPQQQQPLIITSSSSSSSISTMDPSTRSCYTNEIADSTSSSSSSYLGGNPNWQIPNGNNLQADVKSWDLSNPTSLTELYGGGCVASLGKKNSTNFDRHAVPAEITASTSTDTPTITLANHSSTSSGFIAYSRIKSYMKLIDAKPVAKWQKPEDEYHHIAPSSAVSDEENLLTSERTHFHPIKMTYADGHTFEISNSLDPVDFERSESGYMYLESEKYLEYTRSDVLEDDNSSVGQYYRNSTLSLDSVSSVASNRSVQSDFVIRFRVKTTDKACQTSSVGTPNMLCSSLVYQMASAQLPRSPMQAGQYALNDHDDDDEDDWMDMGCNSRGMGNDKYEEESVSMDQWSMAEIGRRCLDNNNSSHTLWGMCPACNNEMRSVPANRLLKAELSREGDEIMSDLKYMQDLYIGNDWEDQNAAKDEGGCDDDDTDLDAETIRDCDIYQSMATPAGCGEMEEEDPEQKNILYNVNKLIADLLRPENAQNLANALGAVGVGCVGGVGCFGLVAGAGGVGGGGGGCSRKFCAENIDHLDKSRDEKYVGGLWNSDENIIWKKEFNPIDIFSRLNNNNNDSFLEKLNWEYSNLAEIWGKALPENAGLSTAEEDCSVEVNPVVEKEEEHHTPEAFDDEENMKIACKNMKNLLKSSTITPPPGHSAVFEMNERRLSECRRMQGFLASNKFKISNRFDRKRRHSASQNVCSNNNNLTFNNNNIYDNNNLKLPLLGSSNTNSSSITPVTTTSTTTTQTNATTKDMLTDYGRNLSRCNNDDDDKQRNSGNIQHDDEDQQEKNPQATIITCKYWTTMRPIIGGNVVGEDDISDDNSIDAQTAADASFFIDKNSQFLDGLPSITLNTSSILKHVTLVSRPLTR